jgi:hypothetical protein
VVLEGAAPIGAYNAVFEGPADLVMARKMEKAAIEAVDTKVGTEAEAVPEATKEKAE